VTVDPGLQLAVVAGCVLAYAAVSGRLDRWGITGALVFTAAGVALGPRGADVVDLGLADPIVGTLVEVTLALVLFVDASRIDLPKLRREAGLPLRLLLIGLPLIMLAGVVAAVGVFPGIGLAEAALLAVVLAPTDASLGQAVVTDPRLPLRLRQGINVESGLNDGIAMPFFTVILAVVVAGEVGATSDLPAEIARQLGWGTVVGVAVGAVGAVVVRRTWSAHLMGPPARRLYLLALPFVAFGGAMALDGSGFIAAFVAGMVFSTIAPDAAHDGHDLAEDVGHLLVLLAFGLFGGLFVGDVLAEGPGRPLVYATLSLTVVRMAPVALAALGSGARAPTVAYWGWFGPRGLASVLLLVLVLEQAAGAPGIGEVAAAITWTVLLSIVLHGLSAGPLTARYAEWYQRQPDHEVVVESAPTHEHRVRRALTRLGAHHGGRWTR